MIKQEWRKSLMRAVAYERKFKNVNSAVQITGA